MIKRFGGLPAIVDFVFPFFLVSSFHHPESTFWKTWGAIFLGIGWRIDPLKDWDGLLINEMMMVMMMMMMMMIWWWHTPMIDPCKLKMSINQCYLSKPFNPTSFCTVKSCSFVGFGFKHDGQLSSEMLTGSHNDLWFLISQGTTLAEEAFVDEIKKHSRTQALERITSLEVMKLSSFNTHFGTYTGYRPLILMHYTRLFCFKPKWLKCFFLVLIFLGTRTPHRAFRARCLGTVSATLWRRWRLPTRMHRRSRMEGRGAEKNLLFWCFFCVCLGKKPVVCLFWLFFVFVWGGWKQH